MINGGNERLAAVGRTPLDVITTRDKPSEGRTFFQLQCQVRG